MAVRVATALACAGVDPVVAVGGDEPALVALGLTVVPDAHPGEGPLGAVVTALRVATRPVLVVAACDLAFVDEASVRAVRAALADPSVDVAVARTDRLEPLLSAWRVAPAGEACAAAFAAGERAVHRALGRLRVAEVAVEPGALRNVNRPGDLPG